MARRTPVQRTRQDGETRRNTGNTKLLASLLDHQLVAAGLGRWQELAVGRVLNALVRAEDADQFFRLVVVRCQVVVSNRPVETLAVAAVRLEVVRTHAQRDASPVVGAAAEHARPPPHPLVARRRRVRLATHLPAAVHGGVKISERLVSAPGPAVRRLVVPLHHLGLFGRVVPAPGLEHKALGAGAGQHVRGHPSAGSGADDHSVINFGTWYHLWHGRPTFGIIRVA